jgi:hypothetical protein
MTGVGHVSTPSSFTVPRPTEFGARSSFDFAHGPYSIDDHSDWLLDINTGLRS